MITKLLLMAASSLVIYVLIAFGLILSQWPGDVPAKESLDFSKVTASGAEPPSSDRVERASFEARDGTTLHYTHVQTQGAEELPLVIMLHGSGWHGGQFDRLAWRLRDVAEVKALTLRGHGLSPIRRGDVDYIGQFEDDIADLIGETDRKVILLGHSSGGGLVVRFAGGVHGGLINGAILLAPFLKHDAPTTRPNSGGWANVLLRRIIGLSMLNTIGVHAFDHLKIIQFSMPKAVLEGPLGVYATTAYSWRLNTSYAPRSDYLADVAKLPMFLLVAGRDDEAFVAEEYEPLMAEVSGAGQYELVDGVGHLDIVDHPTTETLIRNFLSDI